MILEYLLVFTIIAVAGGYLTRTMYRLFAGKSTGCHCEKSGNCSGAGETPQQDA